MRGISTSGIGRMDIPASKTDKASKEEQKAADMFANLMNMTSMQMQDARTKGQNQPLQSSSVSEVSGVKDINEKQSSYTAKAEYGKSQGTYADKADQTADTVKAEQQTEAGQQVNPEQKTQQVQSKASGQAEDNLDASEVKQLLGELKNILTEVLDVTEEELTDILEDFGVDLGSLFDMGSLKAFILDVQDASEVDILVNEDLADLLREVTTAVENLLDEHGINDYDTLQTVLEQVAATPEDVHMEAEDDEESVSAEKIAPEADASENNAEDIVIDVEKNVDKITDEVQKFETHSESGKQSHSDNAGSQIAASLNQAIDAAMVTEDITGLSSYADAVQEADIVRQIIDNIKVSITKESTSLTLQLNPENLGKVQISVANRNGVMQAQIVAETEAAKHAIESNLAVLRETFDNHELKVEAIEVMVASYEFFNQNQEGRFDNNRQSGQPRRGAALNLNDDAEESLSAGEELEASIMRAQGSSVSYSI